MDDPILQSWAENANIWTDLIRSEGLESRKITNPAILNTILRYNPLKVLDMGCGEGWLTRALLEKGIETHGMDGTPGLISESSKQGQGIFSVKSYTEVAYDPSFIKTMGFDAVVFNFSLYEEEIDELLKAISSSLKKKGLLFIQTLHPSGLDLTGDGRWMENAWEGLPHKFSKPHRWYARSISGWKRVFRECQFTHEEIIEPGNETPASLILVARVK